MVADTCRTIPVQSRTMVNAMVNVPYRMPYNAQRPYGTMPCRARAVIELIQCTCRRTRTARRLPAGRHDPACSSGFGLCRPSFKVYFLPALRKRSGSVCALRRRMSSASGAYRSFTLRRRMYHGTVIVTTYRNETANSHQARGAYRHRTAQRTRRGRHQNATSCYSLVCGVSTVLIIRIMIRSASEQALLSARPPLSRLFQSELHASFPSASHPPTGQGLEVASRLYSRLAAPSCPVPNDMLVASKCT